MCGVNVLACRNAIKRLEPSALCLVVTVVPRLTTPRIGSIRGTPVARTLEQAGAPRRLSSGVSHEHGKAVVSA